MRANSTALFPLAVRTCVWMVLALAPLGCATKQQVLEMETEFNARMTRMETGLAAEKARGDRLATQLTAASATATEAKGIGTGARTRADAATAKGEAVDARVTKALANRYSRAQVQEFKVLFEEGRADLSSAGEQTLLSAAKLLADNATYTADVVGHTDDVGARGSNVNLSWRREEMVRRFMVEKGAPLNRFSFIGLGEDRATSNTAAGRAQDRYVGVTVYRPAD